MNKLCLDVVRVCVAREQVCPALMRGDRWREPGRTSRAWLSSGHGWHVSPARLSCMAIVGLGLDEQAMLECRAGTASFRYCRLISCQAVLARLHLMDTWSPQRWALVLLGVALVQRYVIARGWCSDCAGRLVHCWCGEVLAHVSTSALHTSSRVPRCFDRFLCCVPTDGTRPSYDPFPPRVVRGAR